MGKTYRYDTDRNDQKKHNKQAKRRGHTSKKSSKLFREDDDYLDPLRILNGEVAYIDDDLEKN